MGAFVGRKKGILKMKVFTHGSNVNFQLSAREMYPADLEKVLSRYLHQAHKLLLGTIDLDRQELHQYGYVRTIQVDDQQFRCTFMPFESTELSEVSYAIEDLQISHEGHFDVLDQQGEPFHYQVAYVTFEDQGEEKTYFFADVDVENSLMYIATFWEQVHEVGRDTDFSMTGCRAHDLANKWKD